MTELVVVLVTVGDEANAGQIARALLEDKLAACVNIVPGIHSIYSWEGMIEGGGESLLIIKTARELLEALKTKIREIHPYDVPEVLVLGVEDGLEEYIRWALGEMRVGEPKGRGKNAPGES